MTTCTKALKKAVDQARKTHSIQDVSLRTGVTKHTLRFWENELQGILVPFRTKGRQRRYSPEHVQVIEEIKRLKTEGLSLEDIRAAMTAHAGKHDPSGPYQSSIDSLADRVAEAVRSTVYSFLEREMRESKGGADMR